MFFIVFLLKPGSGWMNRIRTSLRKQGLITAVRVYIGNRSFKAQFREKSIESPRRKLWFPREAINYVDDLARAKSPSTKIEGRSLLGNRCLAEESATEVTVRISHATAAPRSMSPPIRWASTVCDEDDASQIRSFAGEK